MPKIVYKRGECLIKGRTKNVWAVDGVPNTVIVEYIRDPAAPKRAEFDNTISCNIFSFLRSCGRHSVAFNEKISATEFACHRHDQAPLRVVIRRYAADDDFLKRHREIKSTPKEPLRFETLVVEIFLETKGGKFGSIDIGFDGPLVANPLDKEWLLVNPETDLSAGDTQVEKMIPAAEVMGTVSVSDLIEEAKHVFLLLEKAWRDLDFALADLELRFNTILEVSRSIDYDSFRIFSLRNRAWCGKRFGGYTDKNEALYPETIAILSGRLNVPQQALAFWCLKDSCLPSLPVLGGVRVISVVTPDDEKGLLALTEDPADVSGRIKRLKGDLRRYGGKAVVVYELKPGDDRRLNGACQLASEIGCPVIAFGAPGWQPPSDTPLLVASSIESATKAGLRILAQTNPRVWAYLEAPWQEIYLGSKKGVLTNEEVD